jgi:Queuosine biosynthesis protein QueC
VPDRLVLCGGERRNKKDETLHLALYGRSQNITLKLGGISAKSVKNIPDLLIDLIEIATYVYFADQFASRGGMAESGMGSDWQRSFHFAIPVRNPDHWNSDTVRDSLCYTLSLLCDDDYDFEFVRSTAPAPFETYLEYSADKTTAFRANQLVLFSGGLDPLGGVIEELSDGMDNIALVSYRSSLKIVEQQKQLVSEIEQRFPERVLHVPVLATKHDPLPTREHRRRSQPLFYASLACVVASLLEITQVRLFQNGVASINLPFDQQVAGTHPLALERLRAFFSAAVGRSVDLVNPFIWKTPADAVKSIVNRNCGPVIKSTISCTRGYAVTRLHTHCGCCSQCIARRFAVLAAEADQHDPVEMYKVELLTGKRIDPNDRTTAEAYVRNALELREISELDFFDKFGAVASRLCSAYPSFKSDDVGRSMLELHQRHGCDIWRVLNSAICTRSEALISGALPATSILMMTVAPGLTALPATVGRPKGVLAEPLEAVQDLRANELTSPLARSARDTAKLGPDIARRRKRGRPPVKLEATKQAIRHDLESGRLTSEGLLAMFEKNLVEAYRVSRDTARKARDAVLSEFVEKSESDK